MHFHQDRENGGGAWHDFYKSQYVQNGINVRPHYFQCLQISPNLPLSKTFITYFSMNNHLIFMSLERITWYVWTNTVSQAFGTSVYIADFVRTPESSMENLVLRKRGPGIVLQPLPETGEVIPMELVFKKIKRLRQTFPSKEWATFATNKFWMVGTCPALGRSVKDYGC